MKTSKLARWITNEQRERDLRLIELPVEDLASFKNACRKRGFAYLAFDTGLGMVEVITDYTSFAESEPIPTGRDLEKWLTRRMIVLDLHELKISRSRYFGRSYPLRQRVKLMREFCLAIESA